MLICCFPLVKVSWDSEVLATEYRMGELVHSLSISAACGVCRNTTVPRNLKPVADSAPKVLLLLERVR